MLPRGVLPKSPIQHALLVGYVLCLIFTRTVGADVTVTGLSREALDNVKHLLALSKEKCDTPDWKLQHLFNQSDQEIALALRAVGYYQARIISKKLSHSPTCWQADFAINPGQQMRVGQVDVQILGSASADKRFIKLLKKLPIKQNDPLNQAQYESIKNKIESLAQELGYLHGQFTQHQLIINKQTNSAAVHLVFNAGQRVKFGRVSVAQNVLEPTLVEKYLAMREGDFYTTDALADTHDALSKSGYFDLVDIRPQLDPLEGDQVPVKLSLSEKKRHHYGVGLGFDTDIGPLINGTYLNRRVNRLGHFFTANLDLSPVLSTADSEYTIPLTDPRNDFFSFGAGFKRENTQTYQSITATLSTRLKHAFSDGLKQTLYLDYSYEDFATGGFSGHKFLLVPGGNWLQSKSNKPLRPDKGFRVEFDIKGNYKTPISDVSFIQAYLSGVVIRRLPWRGKLLGRFEQGVTLVDQFSALPTSYRFYAGGMNSVRGYAYKELGPKDYLGKVDGGAYLTVASIEYEKALLENWGIATFFDIGNAYDSNAINFKSGTGLGVRWYSPIGPIRIDFAVPLNPADSQFQIHFAAGTRL